MIFWWAIVLKGDATAAKEKHYTYFRQTFARDKGITSSRATIRSLARGAHDLLVGHCFEGRCHRDLRKTLHLFSEKKCEGGRSWQSEPGVLPGMARRPLIIIMGHWSPGRPPISLLIRSVYVPHTLPGRSTKVGAPGAKAGLHTFSYVTLTKT